MDDVASDLLLRDFEVGAADIVAGAGEIGGGAVVGGTNSLDLGDDDHVMVANLDSEPLAILDATTSMSIHLTQVADGLEVEDVVVSAGAVVGAVDCHGNDQAITALPPAAASATSLLFSLPLEDASTAAAASTHHTDVSPAAVVSAASAAAAAAVLDPQEAMLVDLRRQRAPLVDRYHPYIRPCDTSLEDARHRLETALEQTRQLRMAFTEQVYKKYRVCLIPPPSLDQILLPIRSDPVTAHALLTHEMEQVRLEKELEKKEVMQLNTELNKSRELLPNLGIDHAEQLMYLSAGLNLVILPEDSEVSPDALRDYEDGRGPILPSGARNRAISHAAATSGELILDRTRKAITVKNSRDNAQLNPQSLQSSQVQTLIPGGALPSTAPRGVDTPSSAAPVSTPSLVSLAAMLSQQQQQQQAPPPPQQQKPPILPETRIVPVAAASAVPPPAATPTAELPPPKSAAPVAGATAAVASSSSLSSSKKTLPAKHARARTSGVMSATSLLTLHPHAEQLLDDVEHPTAATMALLSRGGIFAGSSPMLLSASTTPNAGAKKGMPRQQQHPHPDSLGGRQFLMMAATAPPQQSEGGGTATVPPTATVLPPLPTPMEIKERKPLAVRPLKEVATRRAQQAMETVLEPFLQAQQQPVTNVALVHHLWKSQHSVATAAAAVEDSVDKSNQLSAVTTPDGLSTTEPDAAMNPIMAFLVMRSIGLLAPPPSETAVATAPPSLVQSLQKKLGDLKKDDDKEKYEEVSTMCQKLSACTSGSFTKNIFKRPAHDSEEPRETKRICIRPDTTTTDKDQQFTMPVESIRGGGGSVGADSEEEKMKSNQQQLNEQQQQQQKQQQPPRNANPPVGVLPPGDLAESTRPPVPSSSTTTSSAAVAPGYVHPSERYPAVGSNTQLLSGQQLQAPNSCIVAQTGAANNAQRLSSLQQTPPDGLPAAAPIGGGVVGVPGYTVAPVPAAIAPVVAEPRTIFPGQAAVVLVPGASTTTTPGQTRYHLPTVEPSPLGNPTNTSTKQLLQQQSQNALRRPAESQQGTKPGSTKSSESGVDSSRQVQAGPSVDPKVEERHSQPAPHVGLARDKPVVAPVTKVQPSKTIENSSSLPNQVDRVPTGLSPSKSTSQPPPPEQVKRETPRAPLPPASKPTVKKLPEGNPPMSKEGLKFLKPLTPESLTSMEALLIEQGRFHEVISGSTSLDKMTGALEYLLKVGSAVPIPKAIVANQLKESLCSPGTNYLGSISRDVVTSAIMVWLWASNEACFQAAFVKGGRLDVDPDCKWLVQATAEMTAKDIIDEVTTERKDGLRTQLVAERKILASRKEIGNPNPPTEKDISGARVKVDAVTAAVSCRALTKDLCVVEEVDRLLPDMQQFVKYLEEARLGALLAKAKERSLLANLIARRTTMTDSFSHAYVSSMVRAGEAIGHGRLFEKVQDEELGTSTMIPYDVITDEHNDWEEPCKPSMAMAMGLNADALTRRAHARAMIQKSLRKLQDKLNIKGGTISAGPYTDPASLQMRNKSLPGGKYPPASSPRTGSVKRRYPTSEPPVPPGTGSAKASNWSVFQPRHSLEPLVWNSSALENLPFGQHTISDRPRSVSLSLSARTSDAKRSKKQKLLETKAKEELASQSEGGLLRSTLEIPWSDVADIFQRVELPKKSSSSRSSTGHGHEATPLPVDGKIFAPFCRKVGELKDDQLESDTEEDTSEATVLHNHDVVLGRMKEKLSAYMEERRRQQERRRSRNKGRV